MTAISVYITAPTDAEAHTIAEALVKERLAACANILAPMRSIYHWQGRVEEEVETALIIKTREELFSAVEARVRELHSYDTPCIVALPIHLGYQPYLDWILEETKP